MASFRMEMRKFEINYAKIGASEQGRADPRYKMQFDDGSVHKLGVRLRELTAHSSIPNRFSALPPSEAVSNGYFAVWGDA